MLKIIEKNKTQREEEDKKKIEDGNTIEVPKVKKVPGEIRLRKDLEDLNLPSYLAVTVPDQD